MGLWAATSTSPANGDRGIFESAIQRSYFEMHRTHDIAAGALPYGPGRPAMSGAIWSPVRGGNGGHLEMAECLISASGLEVISNRPAGNAKGPGKPRFSDFQGHFRAHPSTGGAALPALAPCRHSSSLSAPRSPDLPAASQSGLAGPYQPEQEQEALSDPRACRHKSHRHCHGNRVGSQRRIR
jgi:hypothetical protein